jgi:hypothetical protein
VEEQTPQTSSGKQKWTTRLAKKLPWSKSTKDKPQLLTNSPSTQTSKYIAPSWLFTTRDQRICPKFPLPLEKKTRVIIHEAVVTPQTPLAPFGKVSSGKLLLTGPMRQMEWPELTERFVLATDGSPHIYWDYIIPDGGHENPEFMRVAALGGARPNPQYIIRSKLLSFSGVGWTARGSQDEPPTPPAGSVPAYSTSSRNSFWFLEVSNSEGIPTGLALMQVPASEATFKRVGVFRMGGKDWRSSNGDDFTPRIDWDWDEGLEMCTVTIV